MLTKKGVCVPWVWALIITNTEQVLLFQYRCGFDLTLTWLDIWLDLTFDLTLTLTFDLTLQIGLQAGFTLSHSPLHTIAPSLWNTLPSSILLIILSRYLPQNLSTFGVLALGALPKGKCCVQHYINLEMQYKCALCQFCKLFSLKVFIQICK